MEQFENIAKAKGFKRIAGCDEAGRGPLAGPLVVAAVVLGEKIEGLNDSKQLSAKRRERLFDEIVAKAKAYAIVTFSPEEVDLYNVYQASKKGMEEAVKQLGDVDYVLTDAMKLSLDIPSEAIIKGDSLSVSIAAASILAKVTRDRIMDALDLKYPDYGFKAHKGYPTKRHKEALKRYGVTEAHRRSFAPVREIIEKQMKLDV